MEQRRLELSDLATVQEAEIIKNPYRFLDLPMGTSPEEARRAYISLAKKYHPDLVNPRRGAVKIRSLYTQEDLDYLGIDVPLDELVHMAERLDEHAREVGEIAFKKIHQEPCDQELSDEIDPELKAISYKVHDILTSLVQTKMILLNRAYEEIKSRYDPKEWNVLFGYDVETFTDKNVGDIKTIRLEGRGEISIVEKDFEYFVRGPHLFFDFGPEEGHDYYPWDFRHCLNLRHLFTHLEIGKEELINEDLLQPFVNCFGFDQEEARVLRELLSARATTYEVMEKLGVPQPVDVQDRDKHLRSLRFERQINEILYLDRRCDPIHKPTVEVEFKDGGIVLEDYTQSNFSETDYMLFVTLAYGPLLR